MLFKKKLYILFIKALNCTGFNICMGLIQWKISFNSHILFKSNSFKKQLKSSSIETSKNILKIEELLWFSTYINQKKLL